MTAAAPPGAAAVHLEHVHAGGDLRIVIGGVAGLSTDYATRLANFFAEYLGSERHPVPFGGRSAEQHLLDAWLADEHAPPRMLVAAPAGRGKSALLARWSHATARRPGVNVAFVPVSIRFRTNLASVVFCSMSARLAAIHGDRPPGGPDLPAEAWRSILGDYLARPLPANEHLLVVLDGVDEAADWQPGPDLFPLELPPRVRILLSARYLAGDGDGHDWLRRLGWERAGEARVMDLAALSPTGVAEVLDSMGLPLDRLAADVDIVHELHRLSGGDPLLVRLYVDDLWSRGEAAARLRPADLSDIAPGIEGFFDRWWDDQRRLWGDASPLRERGAQLLLDLLACALGPLSREDLLDHLLSGDSGVSAWSLDETLRPLGRFVLGDGREQGYTFAHPRLGLYFNERLTPGQRRDIEARFCAWGHDTLAALASHRLEPERVSPYLVQYLGAHLERADSALADTVALVDDGWRRAWFALEGSYSGFLGDVTRVRRQLEAADAGAVAAGDAPAHVAAVALCALCEASIRSLAGNLPSALLGTLVERGLWSVSQALAYARQAPGRQRVQTIALLVPMAPDSTRPDLLEDALRTAAAIQDDDQRVAALLDLAPCLPEGLQRRLLRVAASVVDAPLRAHCLARMGAHLAPAPLEEALDMAMALQDDALRMHALGALATALPGEAGERLLCHVLRNTENIGDELRRIAVLVELCPALPAHAWPEARRAIAWLSTDALRAELMADLLPRFVRGAPEQVLAEARSLGGAGAKARALSACLDGLPESRRAAVLEEVLALADGVSARLWRAQILAEAGLHAPHQQRTAIAADVLAILEEVRTQARTVNERRLVDVLATLAGWCDMSVRARLVDAIEAGLFTGRLDRALALAALAPHLDEPLLRRALALVPDFVQARGAPRAGEVTAYPSAAPGGAEPRTALEELLLGLVPRLPPALREHAFDAVDTLPVGTLRRRLLAALSPWQDDARLRRTLADLRVVDDEQQVREAVATLAVVQGSSSPVAALRDALALTSPTACTRLVELIGPALEARDADEVVAALREAGDAPTRESALAALAATAHAAVLPMLLTLAVDLASGVPRDRVLATLSIRLLQTLPRLALDAALAIDDPETAALRLAVVTREGSGSLARQAAAATLASVTAIHLPDRRFDVLARIAADLPEEAATEALRSGFGESLPLFELGADAYWPDNVFALKRANALAALTARVAPGRVPDRTIENLLSALLAAPAGAVLVACARSVFERLSPAQAERARGLLYAQTEPGALLPALLDEATTGDGSERKPRAPSADDPDVAVAVLLGAVRALDRVREAGPADAGALSDRARAGLVAEAVGTARRAPAAERRCWLLVDIAAVACEALARELLSEAVEQALAIRRERRRVQTLVELLPLLPETALPRLINAARALDDVDDTAALLGAVAERLPAACADALLAAVATRLDELCAADVLAAAAARLPAPARPAAAALAMSIDDIDARRRALAALAPVLATSPLREAHETWRDLLRRASARERRHLVSDLAALAPVVRRLGPATALEATAGAMADVTRWWP